MLKILEKRLAGYQKYGNLPTIQILITSKYTIRQYYTNVKRKCENILDQIDLTVYPFKQSCPICGAPDCARFIGCYQRGVIDEEGQYYEDFPVPRFLCQGKGTVKIVNHRTFSLLHYQLVPYWRYSIPFIIRVLNARHIEDITLANLLNYIYDFTSRDQDEDDDEYYVELSFSRFFLFCQLIKNAIAKIMAIERANEYYTELIAQLQTPDQNQQIKAFLLFALQFSCYKLPYPYPIRGPCALSYDFYLNGGSYFRNSYFLFGTPSQFRKLKATGNRQKSPCKAKIIPD
jgi:hypothetical protein